jgi:hypothetical protein
MEVPFDGTPPLAGQGWQGLAAAPEKDSLPRHQRHIETLKGDALVQEPCQRRCLAGGVPWRVAAMPVAILTICYKLTKVRAQTSGQAHPWAY